MIDVNPKKFYSEIPEKWEELISSYKDKGYDMVNLSGYLIPDNYVVLNEDKNLHPVYLKLPEPPPLHKIDGFGLPAKQQKFTKQVMPKRLQRIIETSERIDDIWETLENNQHIYKEEIAWISLQWDRYLNGYWFFCNGKPTYLVGWHYVYCNFWHFKNGGTPQYRDRNRKFYHGMYYAYTTHETISYDADGRVEYLDTEKRIPKMIDKGARTFLGIIYPKHRKDGASNMCLCAEYMETITHKGVVGGIISMSGEHAKEKLFDEIMVSGWNGMPFFFKPQSTSNRNPADEILFNASRSRSDKLNQTELNSKISVSGTSASTLYDGGNNIWINIDEAGKTSENDVYIRHQQLKPCVSLGNGATIFGFLSYPSTVGEMEGLGGKKFFRICKESEFIKRDISGQTSTGLMRIYLPATEGLDGFIGEYGESIVDTPNEAQAKFIKKNYGSKAHLESKRAAFLASGDMDGYNEEVRLFPTSYMECFRTVDGDAGFNTKIINDRLDELKYEADSDVRVGNFRWLHNKKDTIVYWEDNPNGKFIISKLLDEGLTNRNYQRFIAGKYQRFPVNSKFTASGDPFKFNKVVGTRRSMGGGMTFWDYDPEIDGGVDIKKWRTHRFVCDYIYRPETKEEYKEDMLMMCVYYGARFNPEIEIPELWDYFEERGYGGYLHYEIDIRTNQLRKTPGFLSKNSKQKIFGDIADYIKEHGHREKHVRFLEQCKDISGIDEMTDYDLIPCAGGCLMATTGVTIMVETEQKEESRSGGFLEQYIPKIKY